MQKCGMQKEGVLRQSYRDNQGLGNYCLLAILRSDWESQH